VRETMTAGREPLRPADLPDPRSGEMGSPMLPDELPRAARARP
jgi:hypothetical protein